MRKLHLILWAVLPGLLLATSVNANQEEKPKRQSSPDGGKVYIVRPADGRTVNKRVKVIFGLTGMGICPAGITSGDGTPFPDTGHHHLLVDMDKLPPLDVPLVSDKPTGVIHFGKGQTETVLRLTPGKHTLQLIFADYAHVPHDPPVVSKKITITVRE